MTVDGETETEKLLEEDETVEPELEQPESPRAKVARANKQQRLRICLERRPTMSARRSPKTPKVAALIDRNELEERFFVLRKAWTLPDWICALEQFAEPV